MEGSGKIEGMKEPVRAKKMIEAKGDEETLYLLTAGDGGGSERYYEDVERFADIVVQRLRREQAVSQFGRFAAARQSEFRDPLVLGLEFLMIGVLWRRYGGRAWALHKYGGGMLSKVYGRKGRRKRIGPAIHRVKGVLNTLALIAPGPRKVPVPQADVSRFASLIGWLRATDEFAQECRRLEEWLTFFKGKSRQEAVRSLQRAIALAEWFDTESLRVLGRYTANVEPYIVRRSRSLRWKENVIFCTRGRVEYHLNMVGAEMMNRAFREDFLRTKVKKVLLPVCMREKGEAGCRAVPADDGYVCQRCSKSCRVKTVTDLGLNHGFRVLLIPHASTAFGKQPVEPGKIGIIGVACVLNLISGGYLAKRMGYVPQCVLLNYSGCGKHWHDPGRITEIDLARLFDRLNLKLQG
ncbi:DUF116 domain-containing protein [Paenibacillus sp. M1]|uniref:DUF116 domain-containing protein n=1 Tax=Paenibacillus haidiansis TaxID=1574488 RepID=A0ABU7VVB3_9BACL